MNHRLWVLPQHLTAQKSTFLCVILSAFIAMGQIQGAEKAKPTEPDYTKGETLETGLNYWALGSTGAVGYFWHTRSSDPTNQTRMILIKSVTKGTPADGVLQEKDVILGVISPLVESAKNSATKFSADARKSLAEAITEAEKKEHNGKLVLNVWRKGKAITATMTLPVLGSYSNTSPWDCDKTKKIIDAAAQAIVKKGFFGTSKKGTQSVDGGIDAAIDALGLLATGEEKYIAEVREFARALANQCIGLDVMGDKGLGTWHAGYRNILLTEYYLLTKDEAVLPGIEALSMYMSLGQSGVGTWSHGMADVKINGLYGPACAYGAMNSCSLTCAISLVLAKKCGIKKQEIDEAVKRSLNFFHWYVDKGTIPYGDHPAAERHDNNGKNSQAAILFDLVGDKEAADFFTRMTIASYNQREDGHTGNFFSWQWGALAAARGGPEAAQSFIKRTRFHTELERLPGGDGVYQFQLGSQEHGKYKNWSTTGSRLLQHCLPRQVLYITGLKGNSHVPPIVGNDLKKLEAAATFRAIDLSTKELLTELGNWSLVVRNLAAKELGNREDNVVKELISMLDSPNRYSRFGACVGLEFAGRQSEEAVDVMIDKLKNDKDLTYRYYIVNSLKLPKKGEKLNGLGEAVRKTTPALLKLAATYEPEQDPTRKLHNEIGSLLFGDGRTNDFTGFFPGGKGIDQLDRTLLIPAIKSILQNPNGAARSTVSSVYDNLTEDDLKQLWGAIYYAVKYPAPSGVMFAGGVRVNGVKLMAEHNIKEGLEVGAPYVLRTPAWGAWARGLGGIPALQPYGNAMKEFFPDIEEFYKRVEKQGSSRDKKSIMAAYEFMKKTQAPNLISIENYIKEYDRQNSAQGADTIKK